LLPGFNTPARVRLPLILTFVFRKADELTGEIGILAGADGEHQRTVATLRHICMAHGAIQINALSGCERHGGEELHVHFDSPFEHEDEFFALMVQRLPELVNAWDLMRAMMGTMRFSRRSAHRYS
jgi:hypothetical protein